jgi:hypothetical protein
MPLWALVASAIVWVLLLPVAAQLASPKTFWGQVAKAAVSGVVSAALGLLIAGLLVDRWRADQQRREKENEKEREKQEAEKADKMWLARNRFLVADLLTDVRGQLAELVPLVYRPITALMSSDEEIQSRSLQQDVLGSPTGTLEDRMGPSLEGPLASAERQASSLRNLLQKNMGIRLSQFEEQLDRAPSRVDPKNQPPLEVELVKIIPPMRLKEFVDAGETYADQVVTQATAVHALVDEFDKRLIGEKSEPLGPAVVIRLAARQYQALLTAKSHGLPDTDDYEGLYEQASTAFSLLLAISSILGGVTSLVKNLWMLELEWRQRMPKEDGFLRFVDEWIDSERKRLQEIQRIRWQAD